MQEALLRFGRALADGREVAQPKSYLQAIVTRLAIDGLRRAAAAPVRHVDPGLLDDRPGRAPGTRS